MSCGGRGRWWRALHPAIAAAVGAVTACAGPEGERRDPLPPTLPPVAVDADTVEEEGPTVATGPAVAGSVVAAPATESAAAARVEDRARAAAASGPADAPGTLSCSVEEAALAALQHNPDLKVHQLTPAIQGAYAEIARGRWDTELFAELGAGRAKTSETARSTGTRFDVEGQATEAVVGVRQPLPTGTTLEATVEHDSSDSDRTPAQQEARLGLTATQALLRGFGPAVNLAAVEQAELAEQASLYELRGYTEALLAETEITYWRYVLAEQAIAIHEESLRVSRRQRDEVAAEIEVGTLPETEAAATRAEVALREQALIDARSELEGQRLRLLRLMGGDLERPLRATSAPEIAAEPITDLAQRLALAERSRADLNEARLRLEERRLETVVTRNGLMPKLDLFVTLGKTGYAADLPGAFGRLGGDTYDVSGGVSLSHLVRNRAAEGRYRAAALSQRQATRAVDNLRRRARLEVRLAVNEVERARQQIAASAATRALQEQKVAAERERFAVGASTALLLAQAQRDLLSSRIAEVRALVDYRAALVELYLAEGSLLERRGVKVGG